MIKEKHFYVNKIGFQKDICFGKAIHANELVLNTFPGYEKGNESFEMKRMSIYKYFVYRIHLSPGDRSGRVL